LHAFIFLLWIFPGRIFNSLFLHHHNGLIFYIHLCWIHLTHDTEWHFWTSHSFLTSFGWGGSNNVSH
jgi:hypothetical protein